MKFISKPAMLWLLLALICLIFASVVKPTDVLDVSMHDTYVVIQLSHLLLLLATLLIIGWTLIQFIRSFRTMKWLYLVHVIGTAVCMGISVAIISSLEMTPIKPVYTDYSALDQNEVNTWSFINELGAIIVIVLVLLQTCWIIQPAIALYRSIRKK